MPSRLAPLTFSTTSRGVGPFLLRGACRSIGRGKERKSSSRQMEELPKITDAIAGMLTHPTRSNAENT